MKQCLTRITAAMLGILMLPFSAPVKAQAAKPSFQFESEHFTYTEYPAQWVWEPVTVKSLEIRDTADKMFIVTGVFRSETDPEKYFFSVDSASAKSAIETDSLMEASCFQEIGVTPKIGDLFTTSFAYYQDSTPREFSPFDIEYAGNALELYGEEFLPILHRMLSIEPQYGSMTYERVYDPHDYYAYDENVYRFDMSGVPAVMGDPTDDGGVDICDVIAINKEVLGSACLTAYGRYTADVDGSGEVDSTDSLNVLKYVVGLIDSLDAI